MTMAVLLMAYGSPNSLEEVEGYYTHIRHGKKPTKEEVNELKGRYLAIGGRSPLLAITEGQARALERKLMEDGIQAKVHVGMKHWRPFIHEAVQEIRREGVSSLAAIPLAPHYSEISIGGYKESLLRALGSLGSNVLLDFVESWHLNPYLMKGWKELIEDGISRFGSREDVFVVFTAHSLPERILEKGDPYKKQLLETASELARMTSIRWDFAFQSAGRSNDIWLGPDILEKLEELSKSRLSKVLVAPVGFVSDHLEILYDIDIEAKTFAKSMGLRLERTKMPNDSPFLIDALASLVQRRIIGMN